MISWANNNSEHQGPIIIENITKITENRNVEFRLLPVRCDIMYLFARLHGIISYKNVVFIFTTSSITNVTQYVVNR